jgi:hypothetical protein
LSHSLIAVQDSGVPLMSATIGGGTTMLVRLVTVHHPLLVPVPTRLESITMQVILVGKPVKILAPYFSPSLPLI